MSRPDALQHSPRPLRRAGLTALITIDLGRRHRQLFQRVEQQVFVLAAAGIEVLVAHNDRGGLWDRRLREAAALWPPLARLLSRPLVQGPANNSVLRNMGGEAIGTEHALLLDADIFPDIGLLHEMHAAVLSGAEPFAMAPCLYLTQAGSRHAQQRRPIGQIFERFLQFDKSLVHHLASPSSVMVFAMDDFCAIGGFCEQYHGHGYEDFDFMIRLALHTGAIEPSSELLVDRTYNAPLLADGFRALLSPLCLNRILAKRFALHLFHEKQGRDPYYLQRTANAELFRQRMAALLPGEQTAPPARSAKLRLSDAFFERCDKLGIDSAHYYALFDARPDYMSRGGRPLRLIRRLFRRLPVALGRRLRGK